MMRRLVPPLFRTAHRLRLSWQRLRRPVTLGVRVLVRDGDGRVLLVRHSYVAGWHLPGGAVDRGESVLQAGARELREEVGLEALPPLRLLSLHARLRPWASDHVALVLVESWRGAVRVDGMEIVEAGFFDPAALPADTTPATRRRLAEAADGSGPAEHW
ncbi:MAG TPA: NUDIX domain-containing protein [Azospirillaceae bacterium]|nr:NUDIX domain-containing protein [Azospirillaceae bacterium]